ncbi:MAG TPA: iron ABC transporter permease [Candidatus Merdenecus merdavium]|nr:iron ABC transporter permease [Candidatus Merdenecus merdavium]
MKWMFLFILTITVFFLSFMIGRYPIAPKTVVDIILSKIVPIKPYWDSTVEMVVLQVRLPRILLAIMVGGALSISGASYQTLFKNPMVSPDILGVSAGAGFGAALAMLRDGNWIEIQSSALVFGLLAVALTYLLGSVYGKQELTVLVLSGVVVSSLFQALLSVVKTLADTDNQLPSITFWLMGGLSKGSNRDVLIMLPALIVSLVLLFIFRNKIDVLAAGEDEATAMGVNVKLVKLVVVVCSTLITVVSVSICGIVGWVGMVIPHIARLITGANFGKLSSLSFLIGGVFLLLIDNMIRGIEGVDLPLGVLTALIGTPVFAFLLVRVKRGWK